MAAAKKYGGNGKAVPPEIVTQIKQLHAEGEMTSEIAKRFELSRTTVVNYLRMDDPPRPDAPKRSDLKNYIPDQEQDSVRPHGYELPKRDEDAYDVLIFNVQGMGTKEYVGRLKYYPNLWDMCRLCAEAGIPKAGTLNFLDYDNCFERGIKEIEGEIQSLGGAKVGEYLITKLTNNPVHPQELLR